MEAKYVCLSSSRIEGNTMIILIKQERKSNYFIRKTSSSSRSSSLHT